MTTDQCNAGGIFATKNIWLGKQRSDVGTSENPRDSEWAKLRSKLYTLKMTSRVFFFLSFFAYLLFFFIATKKYELQKF